jgi:hypothetical protein
MATAHHSHMDSAQIKQRLSLQKYFCGKKVLNLLLYARFRLWAKVPAYDKNFELNFSELEPVVA